MRSSVERAVQRDGQRELAKGGGTEEGKGEEGRGAYGGGGGLLVDAVVVDAALAAHGDAQLAGTALRVPAQSAHRTYGRM